MRDQPLGARRRHAFPVRPAMQAIALATLVAFVAGCGDGTAPAGRSPVDIDLDAVPGELGVGDSLHLAPSTYVVDAGRRTIPGVPVTWSTTDTAIATVHGDVLVAHEEGFVTIVAAAPAGRDSVRAHRQIVVHVLPRRILVVARADSLTLGDTVTVRALVVDGLGRLIPGVVTTLASSDTLVARVQGTSPVVRTVGDGDVSLVASAAGLSGSVALRVHLARLALGNHVVRRLALAESHACAITATSEMICWGSDGSGELGRAGQPAAGVTTIAGALRFTDVDAQEATSCGVTDGGDAWCWGQYAFGAVPRSTPTLVPRPAGVSRAARVRIGRSGAACIVGAAGDAECWGNNGSLLLTREPATARDTSVLPIAGDLRWRDVDAGYDHACGITTEGELACWGILGRVLPGASTEVTPVRVGGALRFTQLASGVDFTCALDAQGAAWCAGIDDWGQLGRGTTHSIFDTQGLAPVSSTLRFASLYAGDRYACGLTADGAAWCWGDRSRGTGRALVPVEFSRLERFTTFAAGPRGACGVTAAGAVRCAPVFVRPGA